MFAALMDTTTSMQQSVPLAAPSLTKAQAILLANAMINKYGSYANAVFTLNQTAGLEPFAWMARTSLITLISQYKLPIQVDSREFDALILCWRQLIPWPGTSQVTPVPESY
jgi:hypothetical protein